MYKHKVLVINNQIMPYRIPLFTKLSDVTFHNITVWYCMRQASDRQWSIDTSQLHYEHKILFNWSVKLPKKSFRDEWRFVRFNPTLFFDLIQLKPRLIIAYEYSAPSLIALLYSRLSGCKLMIWSEMTEHTDRNLSDNQEGMRKIIIPRADGFIGTSHAACDNFRRRGIPSDTIFLAPQTYVSTQFIDSQIKIPHPPTVIYTGYLSERKGVIYLVRAFVDVVKQLPTAQLLLIGEGHERDSIQQIISQHNLSNNIQLMGFIEPDNIAECYAKGDIFVLPSLEDTFAVVAIEAIAAGLTLICSPYAGFSSHVTHEQDGLIIDPKNHSQLVDSILKLLLSPELRADLNRNAQKLLPQFDPVNVAQNFADAIEVVLNESP